MHFGSGVTREVGSVCEGGGTIEPHAPFADAPRAHEFHVVMRIRISVENVEGGGETISLPSRLTGMVAPSGRPLHAAPRGGAFGRRGVADSCSIEPLMRENDLRGSLL